MFARCQEQYLPERVHLLYLIAKDVHYQRLYRILHSAKFMVDSNVTELYASVQELEVCTYT